jgi:hypothetical protein
MVSTGPGWPWWWIHPFNSSFPDAEAGLGSLQGHLIRDAEGQKTSHSEFGVLMALCRLCEALLSFLAFSDKKANTAIGILTDLALEER